MVKQLLTFIFLNMFTNKTVCRVFKLGFLLIMNEKHVTYSIKTFTQT